MLYEEGVWIPIPEPRGSQVTTVVSRTPRYVMLSHDQVSVLTPHTLLAPEGV